MSIDNSHRLVTKSLASPVIENSEDRLDGDATVTSILNSTQKDAASANSTPRRNRLTLHFDHTPIRTSAHFKEPPNIQPNMYGKGANRKSLILFFSVVPVLDALLKSVAKCFLSPIWSIIFYITCYYI